MEEPENELRLLRHSRRQKTGRARRPIVLPLTASIAITQALSQLRAQAPGGRAKKFSPAEGYENPRSQAPSSANGVVHLTIQCHGVQQDQFSSAPQTQKAAGGGDVYVHTTDGRSSRAIVPDFKRPSRRRARPRLFTLAFRLPPRPKQSPSPLAQPSAEAATLLPVEVAPSPTTALQTEAASEARTDAAAPTQLEAAGPAPSAKHSPAPAERTASCAAALPPGLPLTITQLINLRLAAAAAVQQHKAMPTAVAAQSLRIDTEGPGAAVTPAPSRKGPLSLSGRPNCTPLRPHVTPIEGVPERLSLHVSPAPARACQGVQSHEAVQSCSSSEAGMTPIEGVPERLVKRRRCSRPWEGLWATPAAAKQCGGMLPVGCALSPPVGSDGQADPPAGPADQRALTTPAIAHGIASCNAGEDSGFRDVALHGDAPAGDQPISMPRQVAADGAATAEDITAGRSTTAAGVVADTATADLTEDDLVSLALTAAEIADAAAAACAKARAAYQQLQGQGAARSAPDSAVATPSVSVATPSLQSHGSTGSTPAAVKVHNLGLAVVAAVQQAAERMGGLPAAAGGSGPRARSRLPPRPPSSGSCAAAASVPAAIAGSRGGSGERFREPLHGLTPGALCGAPESTEQLIHRAPSNALLFQSSRTPSPMYAFRWPVAADAPMQQHDDGTGPDLGSGMITPATGAGTGALGSTTGTTALAQQTPCCSEAAGAAGSHHSSGAFRESPMFVGKASASGPELSFGNQGLGANAGAVTTPAGACVDCASDGCADDHIVADSDPGSPGDQGGAGQGWEGDMHQDDGHVEDTDEDGQAMDGVALPEEYQKWMIDEATDEGGNDDEEGAAEEDRDAEGFDTEGGDGEVAEASSKNEGDQGHKGAAPMEHSLLPHDDDTEAHDTDDEDQAQQEVRALPYVEPSHMQGGTSAAAGGSDLDSDADDGPPADVAAEHERCCDSEDDRQGLARVEDGLLMQDEDMRDVDVEEMAKEVRALPDEPEAAARCRLGRSGSQGRADTGPSTQPALKVSGQAAEQAATGVGRRTKRESQRLVTNRKSLADIGLTIDEVGTRRSTRSRVRPLQYWRGESKSYGRDHSTLPTVKAITMRTPDSQWPRPSGLAAKVKRKARTKQAAQGDD